MSNLTRSVELKLARAGLQMQSLVESITTWTNSNPITADAELRDGRLGFRLVQKDFIQPPPLDEWGLNLGECIHNLRSALDNLAFALARLRRDPPYKPHKIGFPIYQDKAQFEKSGRANIDQLPDHAASLVERLQPFQRDGSSAFGSPERDALVLLQWLSNADKHRVPSVVLIAPTALAHNVSAKFYSNEDALANVPPDVTCWDGPLKVGAVILEWRTNRPIASVNGRCNGTALVTIDTPHELAAVVPTLQALHQYTCLVVSQFDGFFQ